MTYAWPSESERMSVSVNPVLNFRINVRINAERFVDWIGANWQDSEKYKKGVNIRAYKIDGALGCRKEERIYYRP